LGSTPSLCTDIVLITTLMVPRDAKGKDLNVFVYSTSSVLIFYMTKQSAKI